FPPPFSAFPTRRSSDLVSSEADLAMAPVRVYILGPVAVQAATEIDEERRALATEIVVYLALHREGVHPTVLASAIWPRGVTAAVDRKSTRLNSSHVKSS